MTIVAVVTVWSIVVRRQHISWVSVVLCLFVGLVEPAMNQAAISEPVGSVLTSEAGAFAATAPTRLMDTRSKVGASAPGAGKVASLPVLGHGPVPASGVSAVVLNVTVTRATAAGYLTVYPDGAKRPTASNLNFGKGQTIPNLVVAPVGGDGRVDFYNGSSGTTQIIADVTGYVRSCGMECSTPTFVPTRQAAPAADGDTAVAFAAGLACPAAGSCIAVGRDYDLGNAPHLLAETLAAGTWTPTQIPTPTDADPDTVALGGAISCTATTTCVAAGTYEPSSAHDDSVMVPFVATLDGTTWSTTALPLPQDAPPNSYIRSTKLSCSTDLCAVLGVYTDSNGYQENFVSTRTADGWTTRTIPLPSEVSSDPRVTLNGVFCAGTSCHAVGSYMNNYHLTGLLVEADETQVTSSAAALPPGIGTGATQTLQSISCPAAGFCLAVGNVGSSTAGFFSVVQTLRAGQWSPQILGLPIGAGSAFSLDRISCSSTASCTAIGTYEDHDATQPLLETLTDGVWTAEEAPEPPDAVGSGQLAAISCPDNTECVAVGSYPVDGAQRSLIETYSKGLWTAQSAPQPGDPGNYSALTAISCGSAAKCAAVGSYNDSPAEQRQGLFETS